MKFKTIMIIMLMVSHCTSKQERPEQPQYIGTLQRIQKRNKLRVIISPQESATISDVPQTVSLEDSILKRMVQQLGVALEIQSYKNPQQMYEALLLGKVDLIAAQLLPDKEHYQKVLYSAPYMYKDIVIMNTHDQNTDQQEFTYDGSTLCVSNNSSLLPIAHALLQRFPNLTLLEMTYADGLIDSQELFYDEQCPAILTSVPAGHAEEDSRVLATLHRKHPQMFAMAKQAHKLKDWIDNFLFAEALTKHRQELFTADLPSLKQRKLIRMITRNGATTYFIHKGTQMGFEFELFKAFAQKHGLRIEVVVAPRADQLFPYLQKGKGDVIVSGLSITELRKQLPNLAFTKPFMYTSELLVLPPPEKTVAITPLPIAVRKSSSYFQSITSLQQQGAAYSLIVADEEQSTEQLVQLVSQGRYPATVADAHIVQMEQSYGTQIQTKPLTNKKIPLGWAVRYQDQQLLTALNEFIENITMSSYFKELYTRYYKSDHMSHMAHAQWRSDTGGNISPYDDILKKYGKHYNIDWRLLAAQMYNESKFNPKAVSWAGAQGLMQIMPNTAMELKLSNPFDPHQAIRAGSYYLNRLAQGFRGPIKKKDRWRFALAAYNAGYGHVQDARKLARHLKLNHNRWFHNTEKAMLLLSQPRYYKYARYGYCRGTEPVAYVSRIQSLYDAFVEHTKQYQNKRNESRAEIPENNLIHQE